jgi:hypothetical protein
VEAQRWIGIIPHPACAPAPERTKQGVIVKFRLSVKRLQAIVQAAVDEEGAAGGEGKKKQSAL